MRTPHAPLLRSTVALALLLTLGFEAPARAEDSSAAPGVLEHVAPASAQSALEQVAPQATDPQPVVTPAAPSAAEATAPAPAAALNPAAANPTARLQSAPSPSLLPAFATLGGVALLSLSDHYVWQHATFAGGPTAQHLADFVRPIGTPSVMGPVLVAGFAGGLLLHRPGLTHASARIAGSIAFAAVTTEVLKTVVGRSRPGDVANGDPDEMRLFSGNTSFPSGHTTFAFAAATAIDRETDARWVPWVVYPVAGLVGWSRIHDQMHWMSDVAAGAAVGYFATNAAENFLRSDNPVTRRFSPIFGVGKGVTLGARFQF